MFAIFTIVPLVMSFCALTAPAMVYRRAEKFILPPPRDGPGPTFDATATRAATGAQIRSAASPDICFDVSDFRAGDDRFNNVPLALKKCDSSIDGQKFDLITKGEHNNVADGSLTLIVSSQQFTCIDRTSNINDRTRPGLSACGGRSTGDGETTGDQQFFFDSSASLANGISLRFVRESGNQCLTLNSDGFASNTPCSPTSFTLEQTWLVGAESGVSTPKPPPVSVVSDISSSLPPTPAPTTITVTVVRSCAAPTSL